MKPALMGEKYIYDASTIVARCDVGHLHKYFIRDIVNNESLTSCTTCSVGNKFTTLVRTTVEAVLGVPFIYNDRGETLAQKVDAGILAYKDMGVTEFSNPILHIHVACYAKSKDSGGNSLADSTAKDGDSTLFRIHYTTSKKKINEAIHSGLTPLLQIFDLPTRGRIAALKETKKRTTPAGRKKGKDPLPKTPELALEMNLSGPTDSSETLCIENCGAETSISSNIN